MKIRCEHCRRWTEKARGHVNRSRKAGMPIFCDRWCFGASRRQYKSKAQKVEEKRLYDAEYRRKNRRLLKTKKRAYFERTYDPVTAAKARRLTMRRHVEYCRQPSYRRWKRRYDQRYRAQRLFGPFAESALLLLKLEREVASRMSKYEIGLTNGTINKAQLRRRAYASLISG